MEHLVLSTDAIPERQRFAWWEECRKGLIGFTGERGERDDREFRARIEGWIGGSFRRFRIQCDSQRMSRGAREIRQLSLDESIYLYREASDCWHRTQGREFITRPGDVLVVDPLSPLVAQTLSSYDCEVWTLPRALVCSYLPSAVHRPTLSLASQAAMHGLVQEYLCAVSQRVDSVSDAEAEVVVDVLCRLVAVAYGAAAAEHSGAIRAAKLAEAKGYIDRHLTRELTPAVVAAELRISTRQLHSLFEPTGTSFTKYLLTRRLAECMTALTSPLAVSHNVSDIAFTWGFNSLASFYRAFHRTYGAPPGAFRNGARPWRRD